MATGTRPEAPGTSSALPRPRVARWLARKPPFGVAALVSLGVFVAVYVLAVLTPAGQGLENAALDGGAESASSEGRLLAGDLLGLISVETLAAATALIGVIGLLRRSVELAVIGMAIVGVGVVLAEILKAALPRPQLAPSGTDYMAASFPSGHVTIATTILFALTIVLPYRGRMAVMILGLVYLLVVPISTVTAIWHRVSDTIGAAAIAFGLASLAGLWLRHRGMIEQYSGPPRQLRMWLVVGPLVVLTFWALVLGGWLFFWQDPAFVPAASVDTVEQTVYFGAMLFAYGMSGLGALLFWLLWWRRGTAPRVRA